jgi:hypothetical protein
MSAPTPPGDPAKARAQRRWTWGLVALAFVLALVSGQFLQVAPHVAGEAFGQVVGIAVLAAIVAYIVPRGDRAHRSARASRVAAWVMVLAVLPATFIAQRAEHGREAEKVLSIVGETAGLMKRIDGEVSQSIKAALAGVAPGGLTPAVLVDADARKRTRAGFAAGLKAIDEGLARRSRAVDEIVARVQATDATAKVKDAATAAIRDAAAAKIPVSVQLLQGMRALLAKSDELIAVADAHSASFEIRDGVLEISDAAALERFKRVQGEHATVEAELRSLQQRVSR